MIFEDLLADSVVSGGTAEINIGTKTIHHSDISNFVNNENFDVNFARALAPPSQTPRAAFVLRKQGALNEYYRKSKRRLQNNGID